MVCPFQHGQCLLRQVNDVSFGILCPCSWDRPNPLREIELVPMQTGDLLAALSGERQELDNAPIRTANLSSGEDDIGEFSVVQDAVSSHLLCGEWHPLGGGSIKDGPTHAP